MLVSASPALDYVFDSWVDVYLLFTQAFICKTATRVVIFIQADDKRIGLMAILLVGMAEVSSCETFVQEGARVKKGDEIGTFHFGGSTHCLLLRPDVTIQFLLEVVPGTSNIAVCSAIAAVK
jgi:phosphatidylserine decarboxylase